MGTPGNDTAKNGTNNASKEGMDRTRYVRSRKRFKVYTWKYKKTITPIASFILLVNQIFGFGMNSIPSVIAEGGLWRVFLANLSTCIMACICSLMLLKSMTFIPHNSNFQQRIEYNTLVKYYLSDFYFKIISFLHYIGDFCTIVCGIITFSKLLDMLFIKSFGFTLAFQVYPRLSMGKIGPDLFVYIYETTDARRPFGVVAITLGYVICTLICTRLSCSSLEETTRFHVTSFLILLGCSVQLCVYSVFSLRGGSEKGFRGFFTGLFGDGGGIKGRLGAWLNAGLGIRSSMSPGMVANNTTNPLKDAHNNSLNSNLAGSLANQGARKGFLEILLTFVDNYSVASTLPSWANEMTNQVNPTKTLWMSSLFAFVIYLVLGLLFSKTFLTLGSTSILDDILNSSYNVFVNCSISLFVIVTSIPDVVFGCISLRYNLLNLGYLNTNYSYFWGCIFPFMFTWLLVNDRLFQSFLGNLGLISALICDFFVPVLLYTVAYSRDFSDFTKLRRASKLEMVSGWVYSRLGSLYQTLNRVYLRVDRVYNHMYNKLIQLFASISGQKSVMGRGYKSSTMGSGLGMDGGMEGDDTRGKGGDRDGQGLTKGQDIMEKSDSSTTISSASDNSIYSRGNTGTSASSTETSGIERSGTKSSKVSSSFSTFSAFLSRDSFLSTRLVSASNRLLGSRFSKSISFGSFGRSFSSMLNRRGTGLTNFSKDIGSKDTLDMGVKGDGSQSGNLRKYETNNTIGPKSGFNSYGFGAKFTKSISLTFGNRFSIISNRLSSRFTNRITSTESTATLSKELSTSLSKGASVSLESGLRNSRSFSKNLRKTISANISKSFTKNFVPTTEVMLGQCTLEGESDEMSGPGEGYEGGSSGNASIDRAYVSFSGLPKGDNTGLDDSNNQEMGRKGVLGGNVKVDIGCSGGNSSSNNNVTGTHSTDSVVDYKSFKIIRNSKEFRKTHDDFFNAVNRPSKVTLKDNLSATDETAISGKVDGKDGGQSSGSDVTKELRSYTTRDIKHGKHRGTKVDKHIDSGKERVVVFPRVVIRYHLVIAKLMMVLISMLTLVVPGLHFLVVPS